MRRRAKVDDNQPALVKQIRCIPGVSITHTHMVGQGMVDVIVGFRNQNYLFEIKDPAKPKSARKLTPDEEKFHSEWTGQIAVVETIDDILEILNLK